MHNLLRKITTEIINNGNLTLAYGTQGFNEAYTRALPILSSNNSNNSNNNNNNNNIIIIPGTSTNFKCGLGLERGPPSLVRTIG